MLESTQSSLYDRNESSPALCHSKAAVATAMVVQTIQLLGFCERPVSIVDNGDDCCRCLPLLLRYYIKLKSDGKVDLRLTSPHELFHAHIKQRRPTLV